MLGPQRTVTVVSPFPGPATSIPTITGLMPSSSCSPGLARAASSLASEYNAFGQRRELAEHARFEERRVLTILPIHFVHPVARHEFGPGLVCKRWVPTLTEAGRQRAQHVEREVTMLLLAGALEVGRPEGVDRNRIPLRALPGEDFVDRATGHDRITKHQLVHVTARACAFNRVPDRSFDARRLIDNHQHVSAMEAVQIYPSVFRQTSELSEGFQSIWACSQCSYTLLGVTAYSAVIKIHFGKGSQFWRSLTFRSSQPALTRHIRVLSIRRPIRWGCLPRGWIAKQTLLDFLHPIFIRRQGINNA